jgi:hypothetical protein
MPGSGERGEAERGLRGKAADFEATGHGGGGGGDAAGG